MVAYARELNAYLNVKDLLCFPQEEECSSAKEQPLRMEMIQLVKQV